MASKERFSRHIYGGRAKNPNTRCKLILLATLGMVALGAPEVWAQDSKSDTGDTAWILASSALVMAMTLPGLALFY